MVGFGKELCKKYIKDVSDKNFFDAKLVFGDR